VTFHGWNSTLKPGKPPERRTRLRNRGGTSFKLSADEKVMWKWLGHLIKERLPCDGCGRITWLSRCHLLAKSRGGRVINNIALLCEDTPCIPGCHSRQEKDTDRYVEATGVNLYAKACGHTAQWRKETGRA
jgi:hypothetical protein